MQSNTAYEMIERVGIMAGMRGYFPPNIALDVARTLVDGGINVFEMTMNSEQPIEAMQAIKREFGDNACVGMGTVLDGETAQRVLDAGADFVVAPSFNPEVVTITQEVDVLAVPGVITPTECVNAWGMGVKLLKLFPIGSLGIEYYKAIQGPLAHMKFMCNGSMNDDNVRLFMKAGAVACGMGGWLTGEGNMPLDTMGRRARQLRSIVEEARSGQKLHTV